MNRKGFTLLEVMVVVVIIGIIAAVAIPTYSGYVTRIRRADAITALETVALNEEKYMAENGSYVVDATLVGAGYPNPDIDNYNVTVNVFGGGTSFIATAVGINDQAGDAIIFAIHSDGRVGTANADGTDFQADAELWRTLRP